MCMCVCEGERERKRERERERSSKKDFQSRPCHNMTEKRKQLNKHAEIKNTLTTIVNRNTLKLFLIHTYNYRKRK